MRTALLVDFDDVLRGWPAGYETLEAQCNLPAGAIMQVAFERSRLERAITGRITDARWRQETAEVLLQRFPESAALKAVAMLLAADHVALVRILFCFAPQMRGYRGAVNRYDLLS